MKKRIIRRKDGSVEVRFSTVFTKDEMVKMERFNDDPNVSLSTLRNGDADIFLAFLRSLMFLRDLARDTEKHSVVIKGMLSRKLNNEAKTRKKPRVRNRRKAG